MDGQKHYAECGYRPERRGTLTSPRQAWLVMIAFPRAQRPVRGRSVSSETWAGLTLVTSAVQKSDGKLNSCSAIEPTIVSGQSKQQFKC